MQQITQWVKQNPVLTVILALGAFLLILRKRSATATAGLLVNLENFSTCYQRKQVYLNSCDPDNPTNHADVNLEKRWGKLFITINANLPYAQGGVFHTMYGAYHAFLVNSRDKQSVNLGSLVRHGDRFYKLSTELLGDYSGYDSIVVYRQTEDYAPMRVLSGSITNQQCSSL